MTDVLSILIPTIDGREQQFDALIQVLEPQIAKAPVNIRYMKDNKEMSIGSKRQVLLNHCNAEYFVMIDDDDMVPADYVKKVLKALKEKPDCVGYLEAVDIGGKKGIACHSNRFGQWAEDTHGYDFVRTIFYKDVIKTSIAKQIGFSDMRYGEDHDFSRRLKDSGLLMKEVFINEVMYQYQVPVLTPKEHDNRYGIQK